MARASIRCCRCWAEGVAVERPIPLAARGPAGVRRSVWDIEWDEPPPHLARPDPMDREVLDQVWEQWAPDDWPERCPRCEVVLRERGR